MVQVETQQEYFYGTGKRKRSIARVRLYMDEGALVMVNDKLMEEYFGWKP